MHTEPSLSEIEEIYRLRGADFLRLALARTGDLEQARDAVQEGFAKALRGRRSYRGSGALDAWIARCVINAAHDAWRVQAQEPTGIGDPDGTGAAHVDFETELVREAVRRLPQRQRDTLFLRFYLGLDYAAIAEALGVEIGTVSAALHSARASLADELKEVVK
jgi:RNA polymerase sigma factor (sigma-70 family)